MSKLQLVRVNSSNGELHYVLEETHKGNTPKPVQNLTEAEAKKLTRKEAWKPLFIAREE